MGPGGPGYGPDPSCHPVNPNMDIDPNYYNSQMQGPPQPPGGQYPPPPPPHTGQYSNYPSDPMHHPPHHIGPQMVSKCYT